MGWFALIVTELLAEMPHDHPKYNEIRNYIWRWLLILKNGRIEKTGGCNMVVDKGQ